MGGDRESEAAGATGTGGNCCPVSRQPRYPHVCACPLRHQRYHGWQAASSIQLRTSVLLKGPQAAVADCFPSGRRRPPRRRRHCSLTGPRPR
ncbi:hypothetical protein VFPFJ_01807 [Purpureocillium lilacinum]|uniref:Uncharacterized protein n=1 Tax=Purpureocillium lilacinum TaxID=33203 RepID=A0A179HQC0_PURLI|nr:hypothetical protein VFPFJ_01807 [Purpureocillium lilacinum]OAQ92646.1 hypothetical protein VFPFJ_01807 [Purpureocillium lilacinum]